MRHEKMILAMVVMALFFASGAFAASVEIDTAETKTLNAMQDPETEFCVWRPVVYRVKYTISGDPGTRYKAIIMIKSMGDRLKTVERHKPGTYITKDINIAQDDDVGTHTVKYKIRLKQAGTLVDKDVYTSSIIVIECP